MDLEKTTVILKKINRLHDLINAIGEASSTETDLLKAYVIDLYEAVAMSDIAKIEDLDKEEMKTKIKKKKKVEKKIKKKIHIKAIEKVEEEEEDEEEEEVDENDEINEVDETVEVINQEEEEIIEEVKAPIEEINTEKKAAVKPTKVESKSTYSHELIELFDLHESSELSDKLANAPIKDLTKAMGINERIFTVNEVFGGNQEEMTNILTALNGLDSFGEAKNILMDSVAQKYKWTDGSKLKKAKNFIKLVKRRFK